MDGRAFRLFFLLVALFASSELACARASAREPGAPACKLFQVHPGAVPPVLWRNDPGEIGGAEEPLLATIASLKGQEAFGEAYAVWRRRGADGLGREERVEWLRCVLFYLHHYAG